MLLLLGRQNLIHLGHGGPHLSQRIHEIESRHNRSRHAQGQNDDCNKSFNGKAAVQVKEPADGQHRQHLRREKGVSHGHAKLAALHPVEIILGVGADLVGQPGVGFLSLIKCLNDLDAVDVLDHSAAHFVGGLHCALVILLIAAHDHHHKSEGHRKYHQGQKRQPPVQYKEINQRQHRSSDICRHFRKQVGQGGLHAVHLIYNDLLQLTAGHIHDSTKRKPRQFRQQKLADRL